MQGKACGAKKQKFEAACGNFSFAAAEGGKGFREAFEQTVRSCSDGGNSLTARDGSAGLMRSAPTGPSKPDVFPRETPFGGRLIDNFCHAFRNMDFFEGF